MKTNILKTAENIIISRQGRSCWDAAVTSDAIDMIDQIRTGLSNGSIRWDDLSNGDTVRHYLLNGARSWTEYSFGGCGLIYDCDIAERYFTPSELKKTKGGERNPNSRETWLDVQARALYQAANKVVRALKAAIIESEEV